MSHFENNFIEDTSEAALRLLLEQHPYRIFPVIQQGKLEGIATRRELESALSDHRPPHIEPARTCNPDHSIREAQRELVESATGTVVITGNKDGHLLAFLTLHDVLRAQMAISERERST